MEFFALYRRMRKRESLIVNSFAFAGLGLGLCCCSSCSSRSPSTVRPVALVLAFATVVLIVGGRVFAGMLGGWIGDKSATTTPIANSSLEWHDVRTRSATPRRPRRRSAHRDALPASAGAARAPGSRR